MENIDFYIRTSNEIKKLNNELILSYADQKVCKLEVNIPIYYPIDQIIEIECKINGNQIYKEKHKLFNEEKNYVISSNLIWSGITIQGNIIAYVTLKNLDIIHLQHKHNLNKYISFNGVHFPIYKVAYTGYVFTRNLFSNRTDLDLELVKNDLQNGVLSPIETIEQIIDSCGNCHEVLNYLDLINKDSKIIDLNIIWKECPITWTFNSFIIGGEPAVPPPSEETIEHNNNNNNNDPMEDIKDNNDGITSINSSIITSLKRKLEDEDQEQNNTNKKPRVIIEDDTKCNFCNITLTSTSTMTVSKIEGKFLVACNGCRGNLDGKTRNAKRKLQEVLLL